jgi:phospholipase/lecithinase/hemolysin
MGSFAKVLLLTASVLTTSCNASLLPRQKKPWSVSNFNTLVTFGDSYTDESRLGWFISHNGSAPPAGSLLPESFSAPGGGRTWSRYVVQYTGSTKQGNWTPAMTLYDYAVSGAVCSNQITPRLLASINAPFPDVLGYEVSAFVADLPATKVNSTPAVPLYNPKPNAQDAVYSLWIGTNDLGVSTFLTDSQIAGKTLTDYTDCIYNVFDKLYAQGGRHFVLMNTIPLDLAPLYANDSFHGVGPNQYWPDKPDNHTDIANTMHQYTTSVNNIFKYQTPYEVKVANRYPGAHFALFDVHSLFLDFYTHPRKYLNGTNVAPGGEAVWGYDHHCSIDQMTCTLQYNGTNPDGFLFYDELHPRFVILVRVFCIKANLGSIVNNRTEISQGSSSRC